MCLVEDLRVFTSPTTLIRCLLSLWLAFLVAGRAAADDSESQALTYTNCRIPSKPWSIHIVQLQRTNSVFEIQSIHAKAAAIGLETLSEQVAAIKGSQGIALAAVNGDFYQRDKAYAGAPRGLQIVNGDLLSGPTGEASFWIDAAGQFHLTNVTSAFQITWPNGAKTTFELNGQRHPDGIELYTPDVGPATHTVDGRELVLSRAEGSRWLPLRLGQSYLAHVEQIHEGGNTPVPSSGLVLSVGPAGLNKVPGVAVGSVLRISTESSPPLRGLRMAISGGPILIREGKRQKVHSSSEAYEFSSMLERHPRTAIGWNERSFFLVEVDGRQKGVSIGMTLDELSKFLMDLGCDDALNLDGGGSATLWYDGRVQNSPCDRAEREIANGLVILRKVARKGTETLKEGQ